MFIGADTVGENHASDSYHLYTKSYIQCVQIIGANSSEFVGNRTYTSCDCKMYQTVFIAGRVYELIKKWR